MLFYFVSIFCSKSRVRLFEFLWNSNCLLKFKDLPVKWLLYSIIYSLIFPKFQFWPHFMLIYFPCFGASCRVRYKQESRYSRIPFTTKKLFSRLHHCYCIIYLQCHTIKPLNDFEGLSLGRMFWFGRQYCCLVEVLSIVLIDTC